MTVGLNRGSARATIKMDVELVPPVAIVLVIDPADVDSLSSENRFHRLARDHGELHELDRLFAGKPCSILDRDLGIDDEVPAVTTRNMRTFRRDDLEMP